MFSHESIHVFQRPSKSQGYGSGRVGSGRVGSGGFQNLTGRPGSPCPDPTRPARFDRTQGVGKTHPVRNAARDKPRSGQQCTTFDRCAVRRPRLRSLAYDARTAHACIHRFVWSSTLLGSCIALKGRWRHSGFCDHYWSIFYGTSLASRKVRIKTTRKKKEKKKRVFQDFPNGKRTHFLNLIYQGSALATHP